MVRGGGARWCAAASKYNSHITIMNLLLCGDAGAIQKVGPLSMNCARAPGTLHETRAEISVFFGLSALSQEKE